MQLLNHRHSSECVYLCSEVPQRSGFGRRQVSRQARRRDEQRRNSNLAVPDFLQVLAIPFPLPETADSRSASHFRRQLPIRTQEMFGAICVGKIQRRAIDVRLRRQRLVCPLQK